MATWASSATLLVMVQGSPEAGQGNPGHGDDWSWWNDNSTVIIAILSVAVVAIRLPGVSRGDPQIAYAILQSGGTGNVLIGTLVSALGLLAIPVSALFAVFWYDAHRASKESEPGPGKSPFQKHVLLAATFASAYIVVYTAPIGALIITGLAIGAIFTWALVRHFRKEPEWRWGLTEAKKVLGVFTIAYIVAVVLLEVANPTPWLPIQNFSVAGKGQFSGYMLSQADGETFILTSNPDEVISGPSQGFQFTSQCTPHHYIVEQATAVYVIEQLLNKVPDYPACLSARFSQSSPPRSTHSPAHGPHSTGNSSPTGDSSPAPSPSPAGRA